MTPEHAAETLARFLRDDRLVVLVGAYASAGTRDSTGREYVGLPTPAEFVQLAEKQLPYIRPGCDFQQTCDLILETEQRSGLEEMLLRYYKVPEVFDPPPAHRMLAWLPFSQYITSNYDQFIERSLEREKRRPFPVVDNDDIVRMKPRWDTPVIKFHGCVSRPGTMVASRQDYDLLGRKRSLVHHYIAATLANKSILVVGHGLNDPDLTRILAEIRSDLGEYAPRIYVLRHDDRERSLPGRDRDQFEVITEDLTKFLNRLLHEHRNLQQKSPAPYFDAAWLSSAFFADLKKAAVLPSETQVIDAFLAHLLAEIRARGDVRSVLEDAQSAISSALQERPNYHGLKATFQEVYDQLHHGIDQADCERLLGKYISGRNDLASVFYSVGARLIKPNERILLYSQSQRVLQALRGVPVSVQKSVHLFVGECRPKSPNPYQDAAAICDELAETHYRITVCPDVVAINLIASKQIDRVLMGTHAIYKTSGSILPAGIHSFVNTAGSLAICLAAQQYVVPVFVMAELLKSIEVDKDDALSHMDSRQEDELFDNAVGLRFMTTRRGEVGHLNIGYDLIPASSSIEFLIPDLAG